jgi:hypothetical protein
VLASEIGNTILLASPGRIDEQQRDSRVKIGGDDRRRS